MNLLELLCRVQKSMDQEGDLIALELLRKDMKKLKPHDQDVVNMLIKISCLNSGIVRLKFGIYLDFLIKIEELNYTIYFIER